MTWLTWLVLAVIVAAIAAVTGVKPKETRHVARTHMMGVARVVLILFVIVAALPLRVPRAVGRLRTVRLSAVVGTRRQDAIGDQVAHHLDRSAADREHAGVANHPLERKFPSVPPPPRGSAAPRW